jgi:NADH dehydrogenase/NADH:ubiquinone oxidoreductase subunit G
MRRTRISPESTIEPGDAGDIAALAKKGGRLGKSAFASPVKDFYLTNPIARASAVMAECSRSRATALRRPRSDAERGQETDGIHV